MKTKAASTSKLRYVVVTSGYYVHRLRKVRGDDDVFEIEYTREIREAKKFTSKREAVKAGRAIGWACGIKEISIK